jgi:hypothetical protein
MTCARCNFCDEALWLQDGLIAAAGDTDAVSRAYVATIGGKAATADASPRRPAEGAMRVVRGWVEDGSGQRVARLRSGERGTIVFVVRALADTAHPVLGFTITGGENSALVFADNTDSLGVSTAIFPAGSVVELRATFVAALRNSRRSASGRRCEPRRRSSTSSGASPASRSTAAAADPDLASASPFSICRRHHLAPRA